MEQNDDRFPLDEIAIGIVSDLREQMRPQQIALNAVLFYFARSHGIQGRFALADNGRELILQRAMQGVE